MFTQLNQCSSASREERVFVNSHASLEMGLPIRVGKSILPEEKHRQKGEKPR